MMAAAANAICRIRFRRALDGRAISMVGELDGKNLDRDRHPQSAKPTPSVSNRITDYRTLTYSFCAAMTGRAKVSGCGTTESHRRTAGTVPGPHDKVEVRPGRKRGQWPAVL